MERRSIRVPTHDYAEEGYYFVTICTVARIPFFGRVERDGRMRLSRYGYVAKREWQKTFRIRKEVHSDAFVIMPDHVHFIVNIRPIRRGTPLACPNKPPPIIVPMHQMTDGNARLIKNTTPMVTGACLIEGTPAACPYGRRFGTSIPHSLSTIINQYKSAVTKHLVIMRRSHDSIWQRNYYERIIRNQNELQYVRAYIKQNPEKWELRER